jgi:hypothetical protein
MPRILRPCAVCRRPYAAAYLVPELGAGAKGYVCRPCWEAIQSGAIRIPGRPPAGSGDGAPEAQPDREPPPR